MASPVTQCAASRGRKALVARQKYFAFREEGGVTGLLRSLWTDERGQDIAEYAVMLAVVLVIVVGTIRLIGGSANNVFSEVSSSITQ